MTELWELSATDIAQKITSKEVSAVAVTESALQRMAAINGEYNAVADSCEYEALDTAKRIDRKIAEGKSTGAMAGVPITVKVNVDQAGFRTTNGLKLQEKLIATESSPVIENLQAADAVILGRTNTPAFSMRWFTRNSLHGHTTNPLNPALTPGGSSGGAASAVASGIGALAHGTDISDGNVRKSGGAFSLQLS